MYRILIPILGVSSVRRSSGKVATSISGTHHISDDESEDEEVELSLSKTSSQVGIDERTGPNSETSSITNFTINKTTHEFQLNSKASSRASGINSLPPITSPKNVRKTNRSSNTTTIQTKEKNGVRKLISKIFKGASSSATTSKNQAGSLSPVL